MRNWPPDCKTWRLLRAGGGTPGIWKNCTFAFARQWGATAMLNRSKAGPLTRAADAGGKYVFHETESTPLLKQVPSASIPWRNPIEPARTNLLLQSETFATTWANTRSDEAVNTATAPDGTATADEIVATAVSGTHKIRQAVTKAGSAIQYCFSVYVKTADYSKVRLELSNGVESASCFAAYDLVAKTSSNVSASTFTLDGHGIEELVGSGGWFRIWIIGTTDTDTTVNAWIQLQQTAGATSWTGTGADGIYCWGAQLEAGSFPTAYMPTTTATVSRSTADTLRLTNAHCFGRSANAGSILAVCRLPYLVTAETYVMALNHEDDDTDNFAALVIQSDLDIRARIRDSAAGTTNLSSGTTQQPSTWYAIGMSWGGGTIRACVNGTGVESGGGGSIASLDRIEIGAHIAGDSRTSIQVPVCFAFDRDLQLNELVALTRDPTAYLVER